MSNATTSETKSKSSETLSAMEENILDSNAIGNLERNGQLIEIDRKVLENSKDLNFREAVFLAFPDARRDEKYGVIACGSKLLVRKYK